MTLLERRSVMLGEKVTTGRTRMLQSFVGYQRQGVNK
jgi:hypothetical protein